MNGSSFGQSIPKELDRILRVREHACVRAPLINMRAPSAPRFSQRKKKPEDDNKEAANAAAEEQDRDELIKIFVARGRRSAPDVRTRKSGFGQE